MFRPGRTEQCGSVWRWQHIVLCHLHYAALTEVENATLTKQNNAVSQPMFFSWIIHGGMCNFAFRYRPEWRNW